MYLGPTVGDIRSLPAGAIDMTLTKPARVLLCRTLRAAVEPAIEAATRRIATTLEGLGFPVEEIENPAPGSVLDWGVISVVELAQSLAHVRDQWDQLDSGLQETLAFGELFSANDYVGSASARLRDVRDLRPPPR